MKTIEKKIHTALCQFIKLQYPNVIFTSDASGLRLSMGLRVEMKRKRCDRYKIPDLILLHPNKGFSGLLLEIKADVGEVFKKDGSFKNDVHLKAQRATIDRLNELGYKAAFGCGLDHCIRIVNEYLKEI